MAVIVVVELSSSRSNSGGCSSGCSSNRKVIFVIREHLYGESRDQVQGQSPSRGLGVV